MLLMKDFMQKTLFFQMKIVVFFVITDDIASILSKLMLKNEDIAM